MKKPALFFLFVIILCPSALASEKGLYVSVLSERPVIADRKAVDEMVSYAKAEGYQRLFIQVYRSNEAWFPTGNAAVRKGELTYLITKAHSENLKVHAWMNMLSLSANDEALFLRRFGPSILTRNTDEKKSLKDYQIDGQYFLEPGDPRVTQSLIVLLRDLLAAHPDLDGVHADYIRYPDVQPSYGHTTENLRRYRREGGLNTHEKNPAWRRWKRKQVTDLVQRFRAEVRAHSMTMQFSTTGLMPYIRAREEAFQDWKLWLEKGWVDFVSLMCYADDATAFERYLKDAQKQIPTLKGTQIAVGAYKFQDRPGAYLDQMRLCEGSGAGSCNILEYDSLKRSSR